MIGKINIMTEKEITEAMGVSLAELTVLCSDDEGYIRRDLLQVIISFAIQKGISKGQHQTCLKYNKMLSNHDEIFARN